jgi:hypothetical protein
MQGRVVAATVMLVAAGCGGGAPGPAAGDDLPTIEAWCAARSVEACAEGFYLLRDDPAREACVLAARPDDDLYETCTLPDVAEPVTTVPTQGSEAAAQAAAEHYRERLRAGRERLAADLAALLEASHPGDTVEVVMVPEAPLTLRDADALVGRFDGSFELAWRTDYVCLAGEGFPPGGEPSRVAYRDGVARAERLRREAETSPNPVTGYFMLEDAWAKMAEGAGALLEPGVQVEALSGALPIRTLGAVLADPGLSEVWVGRVDGWLLDLSEPPPPECPGP